MSTLIVYGKPPITTTFNGEITPRNRRSFEILLVSELEKVALRTFRPYKICPICRPNDLAQLIKEAVYDTVVFYGHAFTEVGARGRGNRLWLQTACGQSITPEIFAEAIKGTAVRTVFIGGCNSMSLAADLSIRVPGIKAGGLPFLRVDEITGTANGISYFRILPQAVKWWGK